jgi:hypothetical protein
MRLLDLDQFARFRNRNDTKVLRHADAKLDLWDELRCGRFDNYQNEQGWDVFGGASFVISFIAERQRYAKFAGVWEVLSKVAKDDGGYRYATRKIIGFESLEERLVVFWGPGTRSWAQWLHSQGNKEISELLPPNYVADFPGFYDFTLTHDQLVRMTDYPESNREWHRMLSCVSGVYLVLDCVTGMQYVGSAYGAGGIWSRWTTYAKDPSGGNVLLRQLLQQHPDRYKQFQFSILRVLEPGVPKEAVIDQEVWTKRKLGCRAFGLNGN